VLEKRPPEPWKSKRQSGNKETVNMARERQNMSSNQSTSTWEVLERMLEKNPGLTKPFPHFMDRCTLTTEHKLENLRTGSPELLFFAKGDDKSHTQQSDRSS